MKKLPGVTLLFLGIFFFKAGLSPGLPKDSATVFEPENQNRKGEITFSRHLLWEGKAEQIQFETALLNKKPVLISATSNTLRINFDFDRVQLLQGDLSKNLPGRLIFLDTYSLVRKPELALVTTTLLIDDRLETRVYRLGLKEGSLRLGLFHAEKWRLIRPVGDRMMAQNYDVETVWKESIDYLITQRKGYETGVQANLPPSVRLSSLTRIDEEQWLSIGPSGSLLMIREGTIKGSLKGNYGATPHRLKPIYEDWRRRRESELLRLPPVKVGDENLIAVHENPARATGLLDNFISWGTRTARIQLVNVQKNKLLPYRTIGPLGGSLLDLEVPQFNDRQLLWLRRTSSGRILMEMINFSPD